MSLHSIGQDCENIIQDYLNQLVVTEKKDRCMGQLLDKTDYRIFPINDVFESPSSRMYIDRKQINYDHLMGDLEADSGSYFQEETLTIISQDSIRNIETELCCPSSLRKSQDRTRVIEHRIVYDDDIF